MMKEMTERQLVRTAWAERDPLLTEYYDHEWGMPVFDERGVFEQLALQILQSGLSWLTVLSKREAIREAFAGFEIERVAKFDAHEIARLAETPGIIRNTNKITSIVACARAALSLHEEEQTLATLVWSYMPEQSPAPVVDAEIPTESAASAELARHLKSRGFKFVGPKSMFALMAAIGVIDAHLVSSHRRGCSRLWNSDGTRVQSRRASVG